MLFIMGFFMHRLLFIWLILMSGSSAAIDITTLPSYSTHYDEQADPFTDAVAAIALAKQTKRNVLIEIGGDWCTWCHRMDSFLAQHPNVFTALHQHFVLLKINVSDTNNNAKFMQGLPPVLGYPHMYIADDTGKILLSKDTAELQQNGAYAEPIWLAFIAKWRVANTSVKQNNNQGSTD
jgi:thioredoxin-related protein